jgi:hypothetical protein
MVLLAPVVWERCSCQACRCRCGAEAGRLERGLGVQTGHPLGGRSCAWQVAGRSAGLPAGSGHPSPTWRVTAGTGPAPAAARARRWWLCGRRAAQPGTRRRGREPAPAAAAPPGPAGRAADVIQQQPTAGTQHPHQLGDRRAVVTHAAQPQGAHRGVEPRGGDVERVRVIPRGSTSRPSARARSGASWSLAGLESTPVRRAPGGSKAGCGRCRWRPPGPRRWPRRRPRRARRRAATFDAGHAGVAAGGVAVPVAPGAPGGDRLLVARWAGAWTVGGSLLGSGRHGLGLCGRPDRCAALLLGGDQRGEQPPQWPRRRTFTRATRFPKALGRVLRLHRRRERFLPSSRAALGRS